MKKIIILIILVCFSCKPQTDIDLNPNFVFILADDLGYGELGIFGQKMIETPNIDQLAKEGMILTDHYTGSPVCAPARAVLLTGLHSGNNPIRGNDEWKERGDVWSFQAMLDNPELEGQRPMPDSIVTVAKFLQSKGYKTGMVGKWGLGAPNTNSIPNNKGFDFFYGYNCQRQAHNLYPAHLWENETKVMLNNQLVAPRTKLDSLADPYNEESYLLFTQNDYAPQKIQEKALSFIENNKDVPFFMYYASPLPHLPLQAPKEYVDKYRKILGEEEPYVGNDSYFPNRYPRATYAAMISYLDNQLGELVKSLKEKGIYDASVVVLGNKEKNYFFFFPVKPSNALKTSIGVANTTVLL